MKDDLIIAGRSFSSRFIMGSGKFDPELIKACVEAGGAQIITLALRRVNSKGGEFLKYIPKDVALLANTSGAKTAEQALQIALLARELGCGEMIKVELIGESKYLLPDNYESIKACELLAKNGFAPLVYMLPDLVVARAMVDAGAAAIMPLAAPIGSNLGLANKNLIEILIREINLPIIVDAGIGRPSEACAAMEMGCAAVMLNTAIATSSDVALMAGAFGKAIKAGREAYLAGLGRVLESSGEASSPLSGFLE